MIDTCIIETICPGTDQLYIRTLKINWIIEISHQLFLTISLKSVDICTVYPEMYFNLIFVVVTFIFAVPTQKNIL